MFVLTLCSSSKSICLTLIQFILLHTKDALANIETLLLTSNTSLSCNDDSQVLSIQNIFAVRHDTRCGSINEYNGISSETVDDLKSLCDDQTSCMVDRATILDKGPHLNGLGYYNLSYKCTAQKFIMRQCDFDDNWCNTLKRTGEKRKFVWRRNHGNGKHLPPSDYTQLTSKSKGYFAYVLHKAQPEDDAVATIETNITAGKNKCLTFWFYKTDTIHPLKVNDGQYTVETLNNTYNNWTKIFVPLGAKDRHNIILKVSRNGQDLDGGIAIDDFQIINRTCEELKGTVDRCVSLNDSLITTCSKPKDLTIKFDPEISECNETFSKISKLLLEECDDSTNDPMCSLDLSQKIKSKPDCFLMNELFINYTCKHTTPLTVSDSQSSKASTGATIGVAAGVLCIVIALITILVVRRKKIKKTTQRMKRISSTNTYIGHQSIALPEQRSGGNTKFDANFDLHIYDQTCANFEDGDYNYTTSGNGQIQNGFTMDSFVSNDKKQDNSSQSDGMYFELEKMSDLYEMAKLDVDTDDAYVITDTEYAISGHDYHKNNETNVYSHSIEGMYDSSTLTRKESPDDNNYDHFVGEKTEDDYDISRR